MDNTEVFKAIAEVRAELRLAMREHARGLTSSIEVHSIGIRLISLYQLISVDEIEEVKKAA